MAKANKEPKEKIPTTVGITEIVEEKHSDPKKTVYKISLLVDEKIGIINIAEKSVWKFPTVKDKFLVEFHKPPIFDKDDWIRDLIAALPTRKTTFTPEDDSTAGIIDEIKSSDCNPKGDKTTKAHYSDPIVKETIQRVALDDAIKAGNGNITQWYTKEKTLCDLISDKDYEYLVAHNRTIYWTLNYFYRQVFNEKSKKNESSPGNFTNTLWYTLGIDMDTEDIHNPDEKKAVESMGQFFCDKLRAMLPKSVYALFSGGGIYIQIHHRVWGNILFEPEDNPGHSLFLLTGSFNRWIAKTSKEFFEKFPEHKGKCKADALNNSKRVFKTIFSVHKKYPYAVIPLDPNNIQIDFEKAKYPLSAEVLESGKNWYREWDSKNLFADELKEFEDEVEAEDKFDERNSIEKITSPIAMKDSEKFAPCIKKMLALLPPGSITGGGTTRVLGASISFLSQMGWNSDEVRDLLDENGVKGVTGHFFKNHFEKMTCPGCVKFNTLGAGYPHMDLGELGLCQPDDKCKVKTKPDGTVIYGINNPVLYSVPDLYKSTDGYRSPYRVNDGCIGRMIPPKEEDGEPIFLALSNFYFRYDKEIHVDTGIEYDTQIVHEKKKYPLKVTTEMLANDSLFDKAVMNSCPKASIRAKSIMDIRVAFRDLKIKANPEVVIKKKIGWDSEKTYIMPSITISKDGIQTNNGNTIVERPINSKARFIDMKIISDEEFQQCGKHIRADLMQLNEPSIMYTLLADTFSAPLFGLMTKLGLDEFRYVTALRGMTGVGKSFVSKLMQRFFGNFPEDGGFCIWGTGSVLGMQKEGQHFKDVLWLTDDLKRDFASHNKDKINGMIHGYVGGDSRQILNRAGDLRPSEPIQGSMLITCEDTFTDGAGNETRVCYIDFPHRDINDTRDRIIDTRGKTCLAHQHLYPGFMARYIHWILNTDWEENYKTGFEKLQDEIIKGIENTVNDRRVAKMFAFKYANFRLFCSFMTESGFMTQSEKEVCLSEYQNWINRAKLITSAGITSERAGINFIDTLSQLISSGTCQIVSSEEELSNPRKAAGFVGFVDEVNQPECIYINPDAALVFAKEHNRKIGKPFEVNKADLGKEFKNSGLLVDCDDGRTTKQVRFNQSRPYTWVFNKKTLNYTGSQIDFSKIGLLIDIEVEALGLTKSPSLKDMKDLEENLYFQVGKNSRPEDFHSRIEPYLLTYYIAKGWVTR